MIDVPDTQNTRRVFQLRYILRAVAILIFALLFLVIGGAWVAIQPPSEVAFPVTVNVERGSSVRSIAAATKEAQVVNSEFLLYVIMTALHDPTAIHAGRYIFTEPMNTFQVAKKFANNQVDEPLVTLTIPEGVTAKKIAAIAAALLPQFDEATYLSLAEGDEGFLFPETYFVPEAFTANELFMLQSQTFKDKVRPLELQYPELSYEEMKDILILASIIEREASSPESMKMVSGILHNRLEADMPLQADVTIEYVTSVPLNELAPGEHAKLLQELDSPYNTYMYRGLPPTPIGNPGLVAIEAAFNPEPSDYFYYLTDEEGNFHYAKTLAEHNQNIATYLRQ